MKVIVRQPDINKDGSIVLVNKDVEQLKVSDVCVMAIDGSTSNTGVAILRERDGALHFSCAFSREKSKGETPVQYKVRLKKEISKILINNTNIQTVYYEEPFIGYKSAVPNLMMLRTFVEEAIIENEPVLDYVKHEEINNKKWKKLFLAPDKCPNDSEQEKTAIRKKLETYLPFLSEVTQDEIDAIAMGFAATVQIKNGEEDELKSKKKPKAFQYNIRFIGADNDDDMLLEFGDVYEGPNYLLENGVSLTTCKGTSDFDKHVYTEMGNDDKVLIVKFSSNKHGNIILQYRIGHLAATYTYIYAIIWRKSRK